MDEVVCFMEGNNIDVLKHHSTDYVRRQKICIECCCKFSHYRSNTGEGWSIQTNERKIEFLIVIHSYNLMILTISSRMFSKLSSTKRNLEDLSLQ